MDLKLNDMKVKLNSYTDFVSCLASTGSTMVVADIRDPTTVLIKHVVRDAPKNNSTHMVLSLYSHTPLVPQSLPKMIYELRETGHGLQINFHTVRQ